MKGLLKICTLILSVVAFSLLLVGCGVLTGPSLEEISIDKTEHTMRVDEVLILNATYSPSDASVVWTTSDSSVLEKVSSNQQKAEFKALKEGTATVTAGDTNSGIIATCTVTVQKRMVTITLDLNGGAGVENTSPQGEAGSQLTLIEPNRTGCTFLGWFSGSDEFTEDVFPEINTKLVARYTVNEDTQRSFSSKNTALNETFYSYYWVEESKCFDSSALQALAFLRLNPETVVKITITLEAKTSSALTNTIILHGNSTGDNIYKQTLSKDASYQTVTIVKEIEAKIFVGNDIAKNETKPHIMRLYSDTQNWNYTMYMRNLTCTFEYTETAGSIV